MLNSGLAGAVGTDPGLSLPGAHCPPRGQVEFWQELSKDHPNLRVLEDLGGEIAGSVQLADKCYEDILKLSPHSLPTIRAYAKFLLEVRVCVLSGM